MPLTHNYPETTVDLVNASTWTGVPSPAEVMAQLGISASTYRRIRAAAELEARVQVEIAVARVVGIGEALGVEVKEHEANRIVWSVEDVQAAKALVMQLGAAKSGVPTLFPVGSKGAPRYNTDPSSNRAPDMDDFFSAPPTSNFDDLLVGLGV